MPVELINGVEEVLIYLSKKYKLIVATRAICSTREES
jgi:hypothetical protein